MKKKLFGLALVALGVVTYHWWHVAPAPVTSKFLPAKIAEPILVSDQTKASMPVTDPSPMMPVQRAPASLSHGPSPLPFDVEKENSLSVGKNWKLMLDMSVINKKKFRPELGKKLWEDQHFTFFRSPVAHKETWPVAYDPARRQLFPVSHILHIKGVDENERLQFRAEGMTEYYYHARLKYLSVQSTPTQVVKDYQILKARGFDVRMEVLKEGIKPN
jgi:hypothetical protein